MGKWYNQSSLAAKDKDGNVNEGEITVILTPRGESKNTIASALSGGNNEYTF